MNENAKASQGIWWILGTIFVLAVLIGAGYFIFFNNGIEQVPTEMTQPEENQDIEEVVQTMEIQVYFDHREWNPGAQNCSLVFPVTRTIVQTQAVATAALEALFAGPTQSESNLGYISMFSSRTASALAGVRIDGEVAYVNLNDIRGIIPEGGTSCGSAHFISSLESTLKQFPTVSKAVFAIDRSPETFYEWIQIGCGPENNNCDPSPFGGQ